MELRRRSSYSLDLSRERIRPAVFHDFYYAGQDSKLILKRGKKTVSVRITLPFNIRDDCQVSSSSLVGVYELPKNKFLTLRSQKLQYSDPAWKVFGGVLDGSGTEAQLENTSVCFYENGEDCDYGALYHREVDKKLRGLGIGSVMFDIAERHLFAIGKPLATIYTNDAPTFGEFLKREATKNTKLSMLLTERRALENT